MSIIEFLADDDVGSDVGGAAGRVVVGGVAIVGGGITVVDVVVGWIVVGGDIAVGDVIDIGVGSDVDVVIGWIVVDGDVDGDVGDVAVVG